MANNGTKAETMNILRTAMSTQAALNSMGYGMENLDFAKEMEKRDRDFAKEVAAEQSATAMQRAGAVTGGLAIQEPQATQQKPISSRRRKGGMPVQESTIAAPIAPSTANMDELDDKSGFTQSQMNSINKVKSMVSNAAAAYKERESAETQAEIDAAAAVANGWSIKKDGFDMPTPANATVPAHEQDLLPTDVAEPPYTPAAIKKVDNSTHIVSMPTQVQVTEQTELPQINQPTLNDFNSFIEIKNLPSRAVAYQNKVIGQSLKLGDMFMLTYMDESKDPEMSADIMDSILSRHVRGVAPGDILSCDELYIMHWLRASSYPKSGMYGPRYVCKNCKFDVSTSEARNYTIGFSDLVFATSNDPLAVIEKHREHGHVETTTYDGRQCHIYLRRRHHDRDINTAKREWRIEHGTEMPKYYDMSLTIAAVVEIEGCEGIIDKMSYIWEYPTSQREAFLNAVSESSLSTTVKARVTCPSCGGVAELPFPFRVRQFLSGL